MIKKKIILKILLQMMKINNYRIFFIIKNNLFRKALNQLKNENEQLQSYAKKLENEQMDLKDTVTQGLTDNAELKRKINELEQNITRNEIDIKVLKHTVNEKDKDIDKLEVF